MQASKAMRKLLSRAGGLLALLCTTLACGCVERTYTVLTNPPGAILLENGHEVGPTPAIRAFRYYGTYRFILFASGYQTLVVDQPIRAPWYEYFPLDFITENLIPWTIRDRREFRYDLIPLEVVPANVVLDRATQVRAEGQKVGEPLAPPVALPGQTVTPPCPPTSPPAQIAPSPGPVPQVPLVPQPQPAPLPSGR